MKRMTKNELLARLLDISEFYYQQMYDESPEKAKNLKAMATVERFLERQYPPDRPQQRKAHGARK